MGPNQTKSISVSPIWNTSGTEMVISVPVSVLGPERVGTEMGCIHSELPDLGFVNVILTPSDHVLQ